MPLGLAFALQLARPTSPSAPLPSDAAHKVGFTSPAYKAILYCVVAALLRAVKAARFG